jgi:hypothetical protein
LRCYTTGAMDAAEFKRAARELLASEAVVATALSLVGVNVTAADAGLTLADFQTLAGWLLRTRTRTRPTLNLLLILLLLLLRASV